MDANALLTLAVMLACTAGLLFTRKAPDAILMAGLAALMLAGVVSPAPALAGFASEAVLAVAAFYVIATGLKETGALDLAVAPLLAGARTPRAAQARVVPPVIALSAFVNNTPVVASLLPALSEWGRKRGIAASQLLMPLSYAAILGGTCTLVGTSTNLVVNGLLVEATGRGLGFFEIAWVGLPCALAGIVYLVAAGPWLLPRRRGVREALSDTRQYTLEMLVSAASPLAGRSIEAAGLRQLPGVFLVEIDRGGLVLPAVAATTVLQAGDRLVFAGDTDSVADLQRMRGLEPATDQVFKLDAPRTERRLYEAVAGAASPFAGATVRDSRFRNRYGAVVLAVTREGRRVAGKVGDIEIRPGDVLLLESRLGFDERYGRTRDFLLVSPVGGRGPIKHERAPLAWLILGAVVLAVSIGLVGLLEAAVAGAGLMVVSRCCTMSEARAGIDLQVLLVIGAAIGLGHAMTVSGAGPLAAHWILGLAGAEPFHLLVVAYLLTSLLTAVMTNSAAAVLVFPVAMTAAVEVGLAPVPLAVVIAMGASASFVTPVGYQTNLMVYGPGGYRAVDYLRFGLPLHLLVGTLTLWIVPRVWGLAA